MLDSTWYSHAANISAHFKYMATVLETVVEYSYPIDQWYTSTQYNNIDYA